MSQDNLNSKIVNASKWSTITEVMAKLIAPISSMVLARVLTPEAFGVVATITMIISFAEIFTDAGFQRYLIQHEFKSDEEKSNTANVAFWTNLGMSLFLWLIIGIFSDKLAIWVGNPGLGNVITIACVSIPLAAFSKGRVKEAALDFVFIFGLLGALLGTYGAGNNYGTYPVLCFDNVVSGITHCISGFVSLYIIISGMQSMKKKNLPITFGILLFLFASFNFFNESIPS